MNRRFWKKAGWTGLTILPMVISLALNIIITIAAVVILTIFVILEGDSSVMTDPWRLTQQILGPLMDCLPIILLVYHVLNIVIFGVWYYFGCGRPRPQKPGKVFSGSAISVTVLIGLFMCISTNALLIVAQFVVPDIIDQYEELMELAGLGVDPLVIFISVVIAPIGEEILCRGLTFHYAKKVVEDMKNRRAAFWIANGLQALMFGIMHANLVQGTYAFVMGLCLGWLRQRYRSLYPSMLAHFVVNFSSTFLMEYLFGLIPEALPVYLLVAAVGAAVVVLLMARENKELLEYAPQQAAGD